MSAITAVPASAIGYPVRSLISPSSGSVVGLSVEFFADERPYPFG